MTGEFGAKRNKLTPSTSPYLYLFKESSFPRSNPDAKKNYTTPCNVVSYCKYPYLIHI
jgi:hypothetical protein